MTTTMIPMTSEPLKIDILPEDDEGNYSASLQNVTHLVARSRTPFLAAARELLKRGYDPKQKIVMTRYYGNNPGIPCLTSTIGYAAGLMIIETKSGQKFVKYRPFKKEVRAA